MRLEREGSWLAVIFVELINVLERLFRYRAYCEVVRDGAEPKTEREGSAKPCSIPSRASTQPHPPIILPSAFKSFP
jgi:hypothetical protein